MAGQCGQQPGRGTVNRVRHRCAGGAVGAAHHRASAEARQAAQQKVMEHKGENAAATPSLQPRSLSRSRACRPRLLLVAGGCCVTLAGGRSSEYFREAFPSHVATTSTTTPTPGLTRCVMRGLSRIGIGIGIGSIGAARACRWALLISRGEDTLDDIHTPLFPPFDTHTGAIT
jgi:hypothetical protein